jgi:L-threonylcarbamoyladenylate synthase
VKLETQINNAVQVIEQSGVVVFPTDTLYALSCDALNPKAVAKVYQTKQRDFNKPLPIFFSDLKQLSKHAEVNEMAAGIANRYWPGKVTMILPLKPTSDIVRLACGLIEHDSEVKYSVAARIPNHELPLGIIRKLARPIIGTSANISGQEDIINMRDLKAQIGTEVDLFVGAESLNLEAQPSTIINFTSVTPEIVRAGALEKEIKKILY